MNSRLDLLIYAHDGRGLGHVSRSSAIGLAFKRLFPDKSVLLVTGCSKTTSLSFEVLDWIKLPSYATKVESGVSAGAEGPSGFNDTDLGHLRANMLKSIVKDFNPKVVLADHTPQGKHKELIPALEVSSANDTKWVLGVRGIIGKVGKVWSEQAANIFSKHYKDLIWYGDESVTDGNELIRLQTHFGLEAHKCGYVSRFKELSSINKLESDTNIHSGIRGVISVPWIKDDSSIILREIVEAVNIIGRGKWNFYVGGYSKVAIQQLAYAFNSGVEFEMHSVGKKFMSDLFAADCAIIYGGYNSLTDVMAAKIPSIVLLRGMKDEEQEVHAKLLLEKSPYIVDVISKDKIKSNRISDSLINCLSGIKRPALGTEVSNINLNGAETAAKFLHSLM